MERLSANREFTLLWLGQAVSGVGSQVSQVAYPLLVLAVTGSAGRAGVVGFAQQLPIALLALPAGALADRVDRKRLMVGCNLARAAALAAVIVAIAAGRPPYGLIVAAALLDGAGYVLTSVTERGVLRRIVAPEHVGEAVARNEARSFGAMLAGPPLGGLLFGLARAVPFLVDAVSYAACTVAVLLIRTEFQEPRPARRHPDRGDRGGPRPGDRGDLGDLGGDRWEGIRWLWGRPFLRLCSLLFAASNPLFTGLSLLVVVLAKHHHASSGAVGVMLGIAAGGGLLGAVLAPQLQRRLRPRAVVLIENWVLTLSIPLLLVVGDPLLFGVILAVGELITPVTNSIVVGFRVALAPDRLQGRVQAAATQISFSAGWLGPLAVGLLLQSAGSTATILVLTGWALMLALVATSAPSLRHPPALGAAAATSAAE